MCRCGDSEDHGSSPTDAHRQFSAFAERWKIIHMLNRSSVYSNFSEFGQEEHQGATWDKKESFITPAILNIICLCH